MSYPHDYYDTPTYPHPEHPGLHNRGEARPYIEPDWYATHHDAQLPAISTIGRGPRGEGLYVDEIVDEAGNVSFVLKSTVTGETVFQSPNLAPYEVTVTAADPQSLAAGVPSAMIVTVSRDGVTKSTSVGIPCGEQGSRLILSSQQVDFSADQPRTDVVRLWKTSLSRRPRVGDVAVFAYNDAVTGDYGVCYAVIMAVGGEEVIPVYQHVPQPDQVICMPGTFMSSAMGDDATILTPMQAADMVDQIFMEA